MQTNTRIGSVLAWGALAVSLVDILVFLGMRQINAGRLARQTPPLLEFASITILVWYTASVVLVVTTVAWLWSRRGAVQRWLWLALIVSSLLLVGRSTLAIASQGSPRDRARMAVSAARVAEADALVLGRFKSTGRLPESLADVVSDPEQRSDGWGFRFVYSVDPDRAGYEIRALGVPETVRAAYEEKWSTVVSRRVDRDSPSPDH